MYVLDLRPYQAEVGKAKGVLAESEANQEFAARQVALLVSDVLGVRRFSSEEMVDLPPLLRGAGSEAATMARRANP